MKEKIKVVVEIIDALKASNLPQSTIMSVEFKHTSDPKEIIGEVDCYLEDDKIKADLIFHDYLKVHDIEKLKLLTPAISGKVIERNEKGEVTKFELIAVGLCDSNVDPNIKSIKEQIAPIAQ